MKTQYSKGSTMTAEDIKKLAEATRSHRITEVNPLGGRLTRAEKQKREENSSSFIQYFMRDVNNSLDPIHIIKLRLSLDNAQSVSIARQENDICFFARTLGFELGSQQEPNKLDTTNPFILEPWIEHGSASKNKVRPVFDSMMDFIKTYEGANPIHLWVYEPSRLTRRSDVAPGLIKTLFERGVTLHVVIKPYIDISTERGREDLVRDIERAEQEAKANSVRQTYAHKFRAEQKQFRGGRPPLGYVNVKLEGQRHSTLVLNEEPRADYPNGWSEVDLVQMIFAKVIQGNSTSSIARWLNLELKVPTQKGSKGWDNRVITQLIRNARYAGYMTHKVGKATWSKFNSEHIVKDAAGNYLTAHQALIQPEDFFAANAVMDTRYQKKRKYNSSRLAGIAICDNCGSKLALGTGSVHKNGKRYRIYRCNGMTTGVCVSKTTGKPVSNNIPADGLEQTIRTIVRGFLSNPANRDMLIAKIDEPAVESDERKELLAQIAQEQENLANETLDHKKAGYAASIKYLQDQLAKMEGGRVARAQQAKAAINELSEFDAAWEDERKRLGVNLAILSVIREIRVKPVDGGKVLNRYELAQLGWLCNYDRVTLTLANGNKVDLAGEYAKWHTPKAA